ncbi:MAG TPA: hypothetical protein VIG51_00855 [Candidatus Baltobacteraceae bacterium]|jgi:hypothetical protein
MLKRVVLMVFALALAAASTAMADQSPTYAGKLSPVEVAFVRSIQVDLMKRFPTAADAEKAGYVRYTNADSTGAISYANRQWQSPDARHPSQLWYDKAGQLLGADFSVLKTGEQRPSIFGVNPGRLYQFDDHVHYVAKNATTGAMQYDKYVMAPAFRKGGGDPQHPTAADLVKMGKVANANEVATVFDMPSIWDLIVWVKPNPSGAFAEKNPLVKP